LVEERGEGREKEEKRGRISGTLFKLPGKNRTSATLGLLEKVLFIYLLTDLNCPS
jgi:hypothetical protein